MDQGYVHEATWDIIHRSQSDSIISTLDAMDRAGFVLDQSGAVVNYNVAARDLLGSHLSVVNGRLIARGRPDTTQAIGSHVDAVLGGATSPGPGALNGVAVARPGRRPLFVQARQLRQRSANAPPMQEAIVLVTDFDTPRSPSVDALRALFQLTTVEARLVQALTEIGNLAEACLKIRVRHETGRSYLKVIFTKMECRTQAQLILVSSRLSQP